MIRKLFARWTGLADAQNKIGELTGKLRQAETALRDCKVDQRALATLQAENGRLHAIYDAAMQAGNAHAVKLTEIRDLCTHADPLGFVRAADVLTVVDRIDLQPAADAAGVAG